jgi:RNA polymerase sigma-70 factor (ECF subfamily)
MESTSADHGDQFVELLSKHQLRLRSYIFALVRNATDVDDVLQDACMALWRKRDEYDLTRDFFRWSCGIALVEVLRYRRKVATSKLLFDEALMTTLAAEYIDQIEDVDRRRSALADCMQKLSHQDRRILDARYRSGAPAAEIAAQLSKPLSTLYSSLARIREALFNCVQGTIARETDR